MPENNVEARQHPTVDRETSNPGTPYKQRRYHVKEMNATMRVTLTAVALGGLYFIICQIFGTKTTFHHIHQFLSGQPFVALFITIGLGYYFGKFKIKRFVLGGVAASLIVGVIIGQFDLKIDHAIGNIFFALFIYAVGYQGGPQFFRSLNRQTLILLISATITCVLGLLTVWVMAKMYHLDRGMAAGIAAGGLTQSAIIGTAGDAIMKLQGITAQAKEIMQSNIAVGYAVCYIFGSFGPIIMCTAVIPGFMRWNLREEAKKLASVSSVGKPVLEPGQFDAIDKIATRCYQVGPDSFAAGKTPKDLHEAFQFSSVEAIVRNEKIIEFDQDIEIKAGDIVAITARVKHLIDGTGKFGAEVSRPATIRLIEEVRNVVIANKAFDGVEIKDTNDQSNGVFFSSVFRQTEVLVADPDVKLRCGDEVSLVGRSRDIDKFSSILGKTIPKNEITDFVLFGTGMVLGFLIGMITLPLFGVKIGLGSGLGCLVGGLIMGWVRSRLKTHAELPKGASNFLRDIGLSIFVATVGIQAGPNAVSAIKQYGMEIFFMGVVATLLPIIVTFFISYFLLRIKNPIECVSIIAGGRSANPAFAAILEAAGNSTPVTPFTSTYAIANIWLTLWGPVIVALINVNPALRQ